MTASLTTNAPTTNAPAAKSLTADLARRIVASDPLTDADAVQAARVALVDFLACAIAGATDPALAILLDTLGGVGGGDATLIGRAARADAFTAALANGHAGHALDYDDVHASVRGHPGTVIFPALLAAAGDSGASALDLLAAHIVGLETMARLGLALGSRHYEIGFHATATLGSIGAAAAVARLLGLDAAQVAVALGLAATQSSGLRLQFGYDAKPWHAGFAAKAGLTAARLAARGFGGAPDAFDGPISVFSAFGAGAAQPDLATRGWGEPWQIVTPGLILKEFPCCTAAHCAAEAVLGLRADHAIDPDRIAAITASFPPGGDAALVVRRPTNGVEGRFSVEYVIASALVHGDLGVTTFADRPIPPAVQALLDRVERHHDPDAPRMSNDPATRFTDVTIRFTDGSSLSRRVNRIRGAQDLDAKFQDATNRDPRFADVPARVFAMTTRDDLRGLTAALGQPVS